MSTDRNLTRRFAAGLLVSVPVQALAAPTIAPPLTSHAVVQRDVPIEVRGTAAAGDQLRVSLGGNAQSVRADAKGRWVARLPAMPAGGPYRLEASGKDDVLVGRLRSDASSPKGMWLFVAGDQIRKGAALNAVQIAEILCGR